MQVYNGINEELVWFEHFKSNIEIIWTTNAGNLTYTLGINEFADLTQGVVTSVKIRDSATLAGDSQLGKGAPPRIAL